MSVIEFRPKDAKRRKLDPAKALEQVLAGKPSALLIVATGAEDGDITIFTGGERSADVNWLLDIAKLALLHGELADE